MFDLRKLEFRQNIIFNDAVYSVGLRCENYKPRLLVLKKPNPLFLPIVEVRIVKDVLQEYNTGNAYRNVVEICYSCNLKKQLEDAKNLDFSKFKEMVTSFLKTDESFIQDLSKDLASSILLMFKSKLKDDRVRLKNLPEIINSSNNDFKHKSKILNIWLEIDLGKEKQLVFNLPLFIKILNKRIKHVMFKNETYESNLLEELAKQY